MVVAAALFSVLAGCSSSGSPKSTPSELANTNPAGSIYQGIGLNPARPRPQFSLVDLKGKKYDFGTATAGKPTFLFFGYTNCPDVCPTTLADIMQALKEVPANVAQQTQVVFVTTDVKRDTAAVLATYLGKFDKDLPVKFIGLTGTQTQIDAAQAASGIQIAEDEGQTHSAQVLLYGPDDYAHVSYAQSNNEESQMAHDLPLVAAAS